MADVTVAQFADVLKVPVDKLLSQLDEAGIKVSGSDDKISEDAKLELLTHLRRSHGQQESSSGDAAPRRITLKRKSQSELRLAGAQGRSRTVNVEVRRKRTYIKRNVLEEQAQKEQEELDRQRKEEQDRIDAAKREKERELAKIEEKTRLEEEGKRRAEEEKLAAQNAALAEAQKLASTAAEEKSRVERAEHDARERRTKEKERKKGKDVPLETVYDKYRELVKPVLGFVDELDARYQNDVITVIIPEFVVKHWWEHLLHNQSALILKGRLLFRRGTVVTSVPYHVE
jgi:translation initiation factor IF-2